MNREGDTNLSPMTDEDGASCLETEPRLNKRMNQLLTVLCATVTVSIAFADDVKEAQLGQAADIPDKSELKSMTQASILSFGEAVKKQDFSSFYEDIAPIWQKQTTATKLRDAFTDFYNKEIDLGAAIEGKDPVFNHPASIDSDGVLVVQGYYPTTPNRIVFQLKYLRSIVIGSW